MLRSEVARLQSAIAILGLAVGLWAAIVAAYRQQKITTQVLAASIRNPMHVTQAALAGADIATMPFSVLKQLFNHPLTDAGQKKFLEDYRKTQEAKPVATKR